MSDVESRMPPFPLDLGCFWAWNGDQRRAGGQMPQVRRLPGFRRWGISDKASLDERTVGKPLRVVESASARRLRLRDHDE